ncbi:MAG: hypothetical protein IKU25_06700 [Clostridia bacterium]|nr:hypothetical protein [Clostridia bacterium]
MRAEQEQYGKVYMDTLSAFDSGDIKVGIPQLNGKNIKLRDMKDYTIVSFMTCDLYNLPWIWYHCVIGEYNLHVRVAYPSVLGSDEVDSAKSYYEVLNLIGPNAPNPDNFHENKWYKNVYEKEITLADGRNITALIYEATDSEMYFQIYLDGMMIMIHSKDPVFTDEFWSSFSMAQYEYGAE